MPDKSDTTLAPNADNTAADEVRQLVKQAEGASLEFKTQFNSQAVASVVCALANSEGGRIIIGVEEGNRIVGVADAEAVRGKVLNMLRTQLTPAPNATASLVTLGAHQVLLIEVAPGRDRPYIYNNTIYVRKGASTQKASRGEIVQLINQLEEVPRWEAVPRLELALDDLDSGELEATREAANRQRFAALPADTHLLLEGLHLMRNGVLTNAAAVLFAQEVARLLPQTRMRAVRYASEANTEELADNQFFSGHAFALLQQALNFLERNISLAASVPTKETIVRADRPAYPIAAVREALLNALVHRDYEHFEGSVMITIYPERLEIWNSGWLPEGVTVRSLREGGISQPRNPDLAYTFMLRGLVERIGSGGPRIVSLCRQAGLPDPTWQQRAGGMLFTLSSKAEAGRTAESLNERITKFLAGTKPGHRFTLADYQQQTASEVSERRSRTDITQMMEAGMVTKHGKGKATYYLRTES
jgi:ATP-dependent DNA helicase RecG